MFTRRDLVTGAAAAAVYSALPRPAKALSGCLFGASRWDAWYSQSGTARQAQNCLSPQQWQFRAPWFSEVVSPFILNATGTQENVDAEIGYAAAAGIKFWAYDQYTSNDPNFILMNAWQFHQTSSIKNNVKWCYNAQIGAMGVSGNYTAQVNFYVADFQRSNYMTVLAGRPLLIILWSPALFAANWGGTPSPGVTDYTNFAAMITALRAATVTAGLPTPYIVVAYTTLPGSLAANIAVGIGADAITAYGWTGSGAYVSGLATPTQSAWTSFASAATTAGIGFIPFCAMGWDTRPQKQNPPAFALSQFAPAWNGMLKFTTPGTVTERANHAQAAVTFVGANAAVCASTAILAYSWTELSEGGGGLIPTIGDPPPGPPPALNNILTALAPIIS